MNLTIKRFFGTYLKLKRSKNFSREVFEKLNLDEDLKEELVLAIAEAAKILSNMVTKSWETSDRMEIKILKDNNLEIDFFDKGKPVIWKYWYRKLDDIKPEG